MTGRRAVVLFNLGGPDSLAAVHPFLKNLFGDPAILRMGALPRWFLSRAIARRRAAAARQTYRRLGGASPLLARTEAQAAALEGALGGAARVFVCMRYWHPMAARTVEEVRRFDPEEVVLLPLYPQYSSSTTGSALQAWRRAAAGRLDAPTRAVCCWPEEEGFVGAIAAALAAALDGWEGAPPRILYSAHGVPRSYVAAGDPYQHQVERTSAAVRARLGRDDLEQVVCYQSRVGPLAWTGPYTDAEIARAGADGRAVIVVPIAFVSEHAETLVELDQDYRALARRCSVPRYERLAAVGTDPLFVSGLARLAGMAARGGAALIPGGGARLCPASCRECPVREAA